MNTSRLGKEDRIAFATSRQILLTRNRNCRDVAIIKPINKIRGPKIVGSKLVVIKSNSRDGSRSLGSEENDHSDVDVEVDRTQMIEMMQTSIETGKSLDNAEQHFIMKNVDVFQSNCCQSCSKVLYRCERCDKLDTKRHDRFVPNILRNTKAVENIINNNYDATIYELSHKTEERNRKRNRKQVLGPMNNGHDCALRNYYRNNDNNFNHSSPRIYNHTSAEESDTETLPATTSNSENKDEEEFVEPPRRKYRRRKKNRVNQPSPHVSDQTIAKDSETETFPVAQQSENEILPVTTTNLDDKDEDESVEPPRRKYRRRKKNRVNQPSPHVPDQTIAEDTETETLPVVEQTENEILPVAEQSENEILPVTTTNLEDKDEDESVEPPRRKYRRRKKNRVKQPSPHVPDQTIAEDTETETLPVVEQTENEILPVAEQSENEILPVTTTNLEDKDEDESAEMEAEGSAATEDAVKDDLYSAELNITCEDVDPPSPVKTELVVSMKKIRDEFEVADYWDYIASDDLNVHTDEMDKLLSSNVDGSSIGCDVDDNDVDDCEKSLKTLKNNNKRKSVDIRRKMEYCQETGPAIKIRCCRSFERFNIYQSSNMGLASCEYEDYYFSDDFQGFDQIFDGSSSSTDSAFECEDDSTSFVPSHSLLLPKTDHMDLSTPLTVSDVVPDNVFEDESGPESDPGGLDSGTDVTKQQLDSGPIMQKDDDDLDCSKPVENLNDLELFNSLLDNNILNVDFTASSSLDESCKSILADSNIDFDDERISNMFLPDLDIENTVDIEISKLLELVTDPPLQPAIIKPLPELVSAKPDQSAEEKLEKIIETGCNIESEVSNVVEDQNTLLKDYGDHLEIGWNVEEDFEWRDLQPVTAWSERIELVSLHNPETQDLDETETESGITCSTPLPTESENTKEPKMSKLESLLMQPRTFFGNRPELPMADSKFGCSRVNWIMRLAKVDVPNSAVLFDENPSPQETEHRNTDDTEDTRSQVTEEAYMAAEETETESDGVDFCTHTKIMIQPSHSQLDLGSASLRKALTSGSPWFDSRNPKLDVRKKLVKRKQYAKQSPVVSYPCSFCEQICRSAIALTNHIQARHRSSSSKKYICDKCSKEYSMAGAIRKHLEMHENYTITCKVCGKHFPDKVQLKRHHNSSHRYSGYECRCCGAEYATMNMLTRHAKKCRRTRFRKLRKP